MSRDGLERSVQRGAVIGTGPRIVQGTRLAVVRANHQKWATVDRPA